MPDPKEFFSQFLERVLPVFVSREEDRTKIADMLLLNGVGSVARIIFDVGRYWERDIFVLMQDREELRARVNELLEDATRAKDRSLYRMVRAFHKRFGHALRHTPVIPPDEEIRVRMRLIAEEFFEAMEACGFAGPYGNSLGPARENISQCIAELDVKVDLPEFIDALGDLAYVIEGGTAVCGVVMQPVMEEIQRANMSKEPNGPLGKPTKPEGWTPPDIHRVLIEQGWDPTAPPLPSPAKEPQEDEECEA